ncbi:MAG: hypothetical protein ACXVA7_12505, partial [Isosphaeraceae bacterium]
RPFTEDQIRRVVKIAGPKIGGLLRSSYSLLDSHDIEDILAEALSRFWKYRKRYDPANSTAEEIPSFATIRR